MSASVQLKNPNPDTRRETEITMASGHILVVDDEPDIRNLVKEILEDEGFEVSVADGGESARQARRMRRPDLILLDIWMDDVDGITLLREWSEGGSLPCPIIIMSGHGTVETAVEATRLGAYDFIEKPISLAKLLLVVNRALEAERLQQENQGLKRQVQPVSEPAGKSEVMQALREQARKIAHIINHGGRESEGREGKGEERKSKEGAKREGWGGMQYTSHLYSQLNEVTPSVPPPSPLH